MNKSRLGECKKYNPGRGERLVRARHTSLLDLAFTGQLTTTLLLGHFIGLSGPSHIFDFMQAFYTRTCSCLAQPYLFQFFTIYSALIKSLV
ncbi:hypothetical protein NDU88_007684 [Pleurodeles waltl]|uniref:Uncharacterized protein n=1 Tax=Pleurodeles waltl TaxID=8319 RepID=A0AAV7N2Q8_PLEWA|nr:hypothetical protein NDU88_007684 [Pleurodeles waltl]